ncbi:omptin family outer membrane protease [Hahella ganghwensis]|uniref:omptin family outer membrane protease n=1 Tax=Hahella ganghwensis TaxID=286420 RepID=UPI00038258D9|nr:omptin family outer membrane protease [Hahella ganghwensis]
MPVKLIDRFNGRKSHRNLQLLMFLLINAAGSCAQARYEGYLDAYLNVGYGSGQLDWNIADTDGSPDVLSELVYNIDDVVILELGGRLFVESGPLDQAFGEMRGWVGLIEDGTSEDRDWNSDNRTDLYSFSRAELYGHNLKKFSLAVGYRFSVTEWMTLSPMLGYTYSSQSMRVRNGVQIISEAPSTVAPGSFSGLDSAYDASWSGGWLGGEVVFNFAEHHELVVRLEYHEADYEAEANWNLRSDLAHPVSFRHNIEDQKGYLAGVNYRYPLYKQFSIIVAVEYEKFKGKDGIDTIFGSDGSTSATRLNEVNWELTRFSVGANYRF